jgi:hypothetical protein
MLHHHRKVRVLLGIQYHRTLHKGGIWLSNTDRQVQDLK